MSSPHPRQIAVLCLCLLLAFGGAAALLADALDGDVDPPTGCELAAVLIDSTGPLRPPGGTIRIHAPRAGASAPRSPAPAPRSLRAPPAA